MIGRHAGECCRPSRPTPQPQMTESPSPSHPLADFAVTIDLPILCGDQDAFGHVNNTVPISWFKTARIVYFERSGMEALMRANGVGPILAAVNCNSACNCTIRTPCTSAFASADSAVLVSAWSTQYTA